MGCIRSDVEPGCWRSESEVHVWQCDTASIRWTYDPATVLSPAELERAGQFRFERDAKTYVMSHAALRIILAFYLGRQPQTLSFETGCYGKPLLPRASGFHFNLSHAGDMALIAVSRSGEIGVDIEQMRPGLADEKLANRVFSQPELLKLEAAPTHAWSEVFFRLWTRKEAALKCAGTGLAQDLARLTVSDIVPCHTIFDLAPAPGYVGAVAVSGSAAAAVMWHVNDLLG